MISGGKDAASARYIFTNLSPLANALFKTEDSPLLNHLEDDGQVIEPVGVHLTLTLTFRYGKVSMLIFDSGILCPSPAIGFG